MSESDRVSNCEGKDYESNLVSNFKRKVLVSNFKLKILCQNLRLEFDMRFDMKTFHLKFDTRCVGNLQTRSNNPKKPVGPKIITSIFLTADNVAAAKNNVGIIFGLPGFFCEFQWISEVKCVFKKRTIKVCVSCF